MKIRQIAVLLIRVAALDWFFNTAALFTYLPSYVARAQVSASASFSPSAPSVTSFKWHLINICLHVALSLGLLVYAHPLADFITRDLKDDADEPERPAALG